MATNIFTGNTASVAKVVWVGLPTGISLGSSEVSIGLGNRRITNTGWVPTEIANSWADSSDAILNSVLCEVPSGGATFGGLTSPLRFTHRTSGEDFQLSLEVDGQPLLVSNEVHTLVFSSNTTSGTFTLTVADETTASITFDTDGSVLASSIQSAVEALTGVGIGDVIVEYDDGVFTFDYGNGAFEGQSVPLLSIDTSGLLGTGPTASTSVVQNGSAGQAQINDLSIIPQPVYGDASIAITEVISGSPATNAEFDLTLNPNVSGGTFRLVVNGSQTANIDWDATSGEVQTAIEAVLESGETVSVTGGALPGTSVTIEFTGTLAGLSNTLTLSNDNLTGGPALSVSTSNDGSSGTALNDSITAYWDFENYVFSNFNTTITFNDYVNDIPLHNALTNVSPGYYSLGRHDNAYRLYSPVIDGSLYTLQANAAYGVRLPTTSGFYLWIKPNDIETLRLNDQVILSSGQNFKLSIESNPTTPVLKFMCSYADGTGDYEMSVDLVTATHNENWVMIAGKVDGTTIGLSVNGAAFEEETAPATLGRSVMQPFYLGHDEDDDNGAFSGHIDRLAFFNATLTDAHAAALYNGGVGQGYPVQSDAHWGNAVGIYRFNETAGPRYNYVDTTAYGNTSLLDFTTINGVNSTTAIAGNGLEIEPGEHITTAFPSGTNNGLRISRRNGFTISFWVNFPTWETPTSGLQLFYMDIYDPESSLTYQLQIFWDSELHNSFVVAIYDPNESELILQPFNMTGTAEPVANTWYNITVALNVAGGVPVGDSGIYVNGVAKVSPYSYGLGGDHVAGAHGRYIHALRFWNSTANDDNVIIDEFTIWSTALTSSHYTDHYNSGSGKFFSVANEIQTLSITGSPAFGNLTLSFDGAEGSNIPYNATASQVAASLVAATTLASGDVTVSGGPLPATVTVEFTGTKANTNVPEITGTVFDMNAKATSTVAGSAAVNEVQRVTVSADRGTFTLTHSAVESSAIDHASTSAELKTILDAMGIGTFSVTGVYGGPWDIEFQGAKAGTDVALFTYDASSLYGPSEGGLVGGTYKLKITDDGTVFTTTDIPWNASNEYIEASVNDAMDGDEVAVTLGPLPETPARLTFGERPLDVEVYPSFNVTSDEESLVSVLRSSKSANPKNNTWELTVIPGDGTPGVQAGGGNNKLNVHYFTLRIDTPTGILSRKYDPFYNFDRDEDAYLDSDDPDFKDEVQMRPNIVQIRFTQLDPRTIEQVINEAFMCGEVVKVTRVVHSFECAEFDSTLYGKDETEHDIVRVWYYRDVFRLTFINEFADAASIDSISVVMPEVIAKDATLPALGGLFGGTISGDPPANPAVSFRPIEPRDYMPILEESTESVTPLGSFDATGIKDDAAYLNYRTALAFQLAWMAGTPINKHEIVRTSEVVDDHLTYRYNMQNLTVDHLANPTSSTRIGVADMLVNGQIQFSWCTRTFPTEGSQRMGPVYTTISETPFLDWDSSPEVIQDAIANLILGSGNVGIFPGVDGVLVEGSLYNSWKSDPYQNYGNVTDESDLDSADRYSDLRVTLIGPWAKQPFNEYEYCLRCTYRNNYPWIKPREAANLEAKGTDAEDSITSSYEQTARNPKIWMDEVSKPLLPRRNQRLRLDITEHEDDSVTLLLDGNTFIVDRDQTATAFESQLNGVLGRIPQVATKRTMLWNDEDRRWDEELTIVGDDGFEWVPFKYLKSVTTYGTSLDRHPVDIEFTGMGYQYNDVTVPTLTSETEQATFATVTEIQEGILGVDEVQTLTISGSPISGTYKLVYDGDATTDLDFDADAATIQTALESLTGLSSGDVTVTGEAPSFVFTFDGPLIDAEPITLQDVNMLGVCTATVSNPSVGGLGGSLTILESVKGSGPQFFDVPGNWSLGRLPSSGDDLIIDEAVQPILYGLNLSGTFVVASADGLYLDSERRRRFLVGQKVYVRAGSEVGDALPTGLTEGYYFIKESFNDGTFTLSVTDGGSRVVSSGTGTGYSRIEIRDCTLSVYSRFAGAQIGLPKRRGDEIEYLPTYLTMGFTDIIIGIGDGDGMTLSRINTLDSDTAIEVRNTAGSSVDNVPTALFLTNNTNTALTVRSGGDVGVAVYAGESSILGDVVVDDGGRLTIPQASITGTWTNNGDLLTLHTGVSG